MVKAEAVGPAEPRGALDLDTHAAEAEGPPHLDLGLGRPAVPDAGMPVGAQSCLLPWRDSRKKQYSISF